MNHRRSAWLIPELRLDFTHPVNRVDPKSLTEMDFTIARSILDTTRFIATTHIQTVVLSSVSPAFLVHPPMALAWQILRLPWASIPKIFWLDHQANKIIYKKGELSPDERILMTRMLIEDRLPDLFTFRDASVCLVEEARRTGLKIHRITEVFKALGFTHFSAAAFATSDQHMENEFPFPSNYYSALYNDAVAEFLLNFADDLSYRYRIEHQVPDEYYRWLDRCHLAMRLIQAEQN